MGKADITMNECLTDEVRYADCFNTAAGEKLITPERLVRMERIAEGGIRLPRTVAYYKKERDGIQAVQNIDGVVCAIVCTENQTDIHYAEAARQFILDAYSYNKQLTDIRKRHEVEEQRKKHSYQGFTPDDRLIPAVTVCVYYGQEAWNAPVRLVDLMDFSGFDKKEARLWRKYIQDYRIIVLDIRRMPDEQIEHMTSDLKLLFGMLKNSEDKATLQAYIHRHAQEVDMLKEDLAEAFMVLSGTAGLKKYLNHNKKEEGGTIRMCKAIDDMIKDSKAEGRLEGEETGRYSTFVELIKDNLISISEAAKRLNMTEEALLKRMEA